MEYYSAIKKNLPFGTKWIDFEGIFIREKGQRKTTTIWYYLYAESEKYNKPVNITKRNRLTDIENTIVDTMREIGSLGVENKRY